MMFNQWKFLTTSLFFVGAISTTEASTIAVTCPAQTLQSGVDGAQPGDFINVSGACVENVLVRNEKSRITINGGGSATLTAASNTLPAIAIRGKGINVVALTITGGLNGINVARLANATLDHNTISGATGSGITVNQGSFAIISNSSVTANGANGILVDEGSTARIGFNSSSDSSSSSNTVQNNANNGIEIAGHSSAYIAANTVSGNGGNGIAVFRLSSAILASNQVDSNGATAPQPGNGVVVSGNSVVQLGNDDFTGFLGGANTTVTNNTNYGLKCQLGAAVMGHWGATNPLNGAAGQQSIEGSCPNAIQTP